MKKSITAILIVAIIATASLFATTAPSPADLNLKTQISGINMMKLTKNIFSPSPASVSTFNSAEANETLEEVSSSTNTGTIAYLSILTNKRTGFTVTMSAAALTPATDGNTFSIDYVVTASSATYDTAAETNTSNTIVVNSGITGLSAFSYPVSVDLDDTDYDAALEDTYTGTVTFTYTTNS
jgi:hypothetical protein